MGLLLTGGEGFIGEYLKRALKREKLSYSVWQKDVREIERFDEEPDCIIHLASKREGSNYQENLGACDVNVRGTLAIANLARRTGARVVFASTAGVYAHGIGSDGLQVAESSPVDPSRLYSQSKYFGECILKSLLPARDLIILRLFNVYGPGQSERFLVPDLIRSVRCGTVELRMPDAIRDFVWVEDVVSALLQFVRPRAAAGVYNVGSGRPARVREVLEQVAELIGTPYKISYGAQAAGEHPGIYADVSRLRSTGWEPMVNLSDGLRKCVQAALAEGAYQNSEP